jgi:hypothetical protein
MINRSEILFSLPIGILLITLNSHGEALTLGNTTMWWVIQAALLIIFLIIKFNYTSKAHLKSLVLMDVYLIYVVISFVRGTFLTEGYWDWKALLSNTMCLLVPMLSYASDSKILVKHIFKNYVFYTAPIFLGFQFLLRKDEFGFYLAPFSYLLLFTPILSNTWKLICLTIAVYVIFADFGARSNFIKFSVPILLSLIYYLKEYISVKFLEFIRMLLILFPIVFFALGVAGVFNLFNPNGEKQKTVMQQSRDSNGNIVEDDLLADTRTPLFVEVLNNAKVFNAWIFGMSPARGNLSESFGENDLSKRGERNGNEVAILNFFVWLGAVGVIFMGIFFYQASYLAVNQSNNIFSKILGLFIAFQWAYSWVENRNNFQIHYLFLWIVVGMCVSKSFRQMNNADIKRWVLDIFKNNYNII